MNTIVTFDFDGTLSRTDVQEYFKELVSRGIDCWVLTSRYDELHKHRYPKNPTNDDLWKVIDELNIPRWKVRFTNMELKAYYLESTDVIFHIDDDIIECEELKFMNTTPIFMDENWKYNCEVLLKNKIPVL